MNIDQIREWYANPPRNNDIAGWDEIHRAIGTPEGSDASMRAWAMQAMLEELVKFAKRNNVAKTPTLAQDETEVQPTQTASQEAGGDPAKDLARLFALSSKMHDFWSDDDFEEYKAIGRKWGLV